MKNTSLAFDYLTRSEKRLKAVDTLFTEEAWADVVRESQEIVELSLKGLLRHWNVEVPRIHDVSEILKDAAKKRSKEIQKTISKLCETSRGLRRDRELAFYGSEDLTPSEFYKKTDAENARSRAKELVRSVKNLMS